jgi:predicted amidohydrolase
MVKNAEEYLYAAAKEKPDLMVLPENFAHLQLETELLNKVAEVIPDKNAPLQKKMSEIAKNIHCNLVFGLTEVDQGKHYNSVIVYDRNGEYVGKYKKTHLCPTEMHYYSQGDELTVFDLDIGKLGIAVCMDIHYQEMWRVMALMGADIIAHPTGWRDYTGDFCESIVNARAIDNQNYKVTSHLVEAPYLSGKLFGHSRIVDPYGRTRADTGHIPGYAITTVDLDEVYEYWVTGEMKKKYPTLKECFFDMRKPETYGLICKKDEEKKWKLKNPVVRAK